MVGTEGMSSELLQAAGHIVTQAAPQLDRVAFRNKGGPLLTPVTALLDVCSKLVPGAVSVRLTVQGEVSPQWSGVATQLTVTATSDQGAPLRLGQRARAVLVLLHRF